MPLLLSPRPNADRRPLSIDFDGIVPDRIAALGRAEIARLPIRADARPCELGEIFDVAGDGADHVIECRGDFSRVHRIAAGMGGGTLRIDGSVGRHAAEGMRGGRVEIAGDAGDWLAAELLGGEVVVAGGTGDNVAAALPGSRHGMQGGIVLVGGSAGALVGARMRRGIVAIAGRCGAGAGFEMRAGTVVIGETTGPHAGLGMRRGSVITLTGRPAVPPSFRRGAAWRPAFLPVLLRRLAGAGYLPAKRALAHAAWRQWHGDPLAGGRGEILHPE